jgi:hypothetical protein
VECEHAADDLITSKAAERIAPMKRVRKTTLDHLSKKKSRRAA